MEGEEIWRSLQPLTSFYDKFKEQPLFGEWEVSNLGKCRNVRTGRETKPRLFRGDYWVTFNLPQVNAKGDFLFPRLQCMAFYGPPPTPQHTVDHIDRDHHNLNVSNLRWASKSEQTHNRGALDMSKRKRFVHVYRKGEDEPILGPLSYEDVTTELNNITQTTKFNPKNISTALAGKKSLYGFTFAYGDTDDLPGEEWKQVPSDDYETPVFASNLGRIWFGGTGKKDMPTPDKTDDGGGYLRIAIKRKDGTTHYALGHRLVALAWIPNDDPEHKTTVCHRNNIKHDNRVENLYWDTHRNNSIAAVESGLTKAKRVRAIHTETGEEHVFISQREAERKLKVHNGNIGLVIKGAVKHAKKWKFELVE